MVPDVAVLKQVGSSESYLSVVKDGKACLLYTSDSGLEGDSAG